MADPEAPIEDLEDGEIESDCEDVPEVDKTKNEETEMAVENPQEEKTDTQNFYYSKSGKKKKTKSHKNEGKRDKSKKSRKYSINNEDDFAGNIERAIRKAMNKNDDSEPQGNDVDDRRKHKKRKKYDGNDSSKKKRKKQEVSDEVDEIEMMCVRGASPIQKSSSNDMFPDEDSYASDSSQSDSRESQPQRKKRQRLPQRERNKNKNDRRRGTHPMQDPDGVCLYYMQGKCHKGDDCIYSHDAQPPRKMELCKFYLMDCCAKRDKCLYMHSDFPCKYYHTGLPCVFKDECKFAHGKPLNDGLKNILLKHIESAPKEILGDFPRLNRDGALKMIQTTQLKLMQKFSDNSDTHGKNIPSLFDLNIPNPLNNSDGMQGNQFNNEKHNRLSSKVRQSRWQNDNLNQNHNMSMSPKNNTGTSNILNIKNLTGVLTPRQISDLTKMGIENLDQLGQLTVLQLNGIGISIKQITEIQLNTMSIQKLGLINNVDQQPQVIGSPASKDLDLRVPPAVPALNNLTTSSELSGQDIDMRFQQNLVQNNEGTSKNMSLKKDIQNKDMIDIDQYTKDALKFASKDKENIDISNESFENEKIITAIETKDVDHRVLPFPDDDSRSNRLKVEENPLTTEVDTDIRFLQPEPMYKHTGKRHRLSTTDDDEDNNLLIDEKWYSSDEEKSNKKHSPSCSPKKTISNELTPSVIEPASVISKLGDLSKIDISEEVTKLLNTMKNNLQENTTGNNDVTSSVVSRDPRSRRSPIKTSEPSKPVTIKKSPRISIYECVDGEPTDGRRRSDVDLRQTEFKLAGFGDTDLRQGSSGDIDFRLGLPFKPLPNYTPASEINGSITSHPPITYKLVTVHIPRPDYTDIRNSTAKSQALTDPRLRKVFRLSLDDSNSDSEKSSQVASTTTRVDPRRKVKDLSDGNDNQEQKSNKTLDLQTILQGSNWFKELSSTQKIFVNQNLAPVTQMLKQYQQEKMLGKKFDILSIQSNNVLCSIFTNLNVSLGENGEFTLLPKPKEALLKTPVNFNPAPPFGMNSNISAPGHIDSNMNMMNVPPISIGSMHGYNQQIPDLRGGGDPRGDPRGDLRGDPRDLRGDPRDLRGDPRDLRGDPRDLRGDPRDLRGDPRGAPTPGLLGIAPNIPHNFNNQFSGPPNFGNIGFNQDFSYMDDQNFPRFPNRGGHRGRGNDRWNRGGSARGHRDRKNFNDRGNWKNDRH